MTITVSKNLDRRIKLLSAEIKSLKTIKDNNILYKTDIERIKECQKQLNICKQLLRTELVNAPIKEIL